MKAILIITYVTSRARVIFKGRVQGVFFRANTAEKARD
jgi:acylphosphatase